MSRVLALLLLCAAAGPRAEPAPFEVAVLAAVGEDRETRGGALALRWQRSAEHALGLELLGLEEDPGGRRRTLALRWIAINPEPLWRPSLELGLGRATGAGRPAGWVGSAGIGGRWELVPRRLDLALELRYRVEEGRPGGRGHTLLMLGLGLPLGRP